MVTLKDPLRSRAEDGLWDQPAYLASWGCPYLGNLPELALAQCCLPLTSSMSSVNKSTFQHSILVGFGRYGRPQMWGSRIDNRSDRHNDVANCSWIVGVPQPNLLGPAPCVGHALRGGRRIV